MQIRAFKHHACKRRRVVTKTLIVMKITTFLILVSCLQISARGLSQTVTFNGINVPLQKVFAAVKKQTGYTFMYNSEQIEKAKPVTINLMDTPLEKFLQQVLTGQPFEYSIENTTIFISLKASSQGVQNLPSKGASVNLPPPPGITVSGRIVNELNKPLADASVKIRGTKTGVKTDADGHFTINTDEGDVLVVSFVGYLGISMKITQTNKVGTAVVVASERSSNAASDNIGSNDMEAVSAIVNATVSNLLIKLSPSISALNEVVVNKGYYSESQRLTTGNVTKVKSEDIVKQPVDNVLAALEGRVPGLVVNQTNGLPGSNINIKIRGLSSVSGTNNPLLIVDGIPYPLDGISTLSNTTDTKGNPVYLTGPNGTGSPVASINPNDIESIEVLKDGDATAIYGSRASNGVLLITTKKGRSGKTVASVNMQQSYSRVPYKMKVLDIHDYLSMRRQAFANDGITPTAAKAPDLLVWDSTKTTDWQKVLLGNTAQKTEVNGSVSGGSSNLTFLLSGTYSRQSSIFPDSRMNSSGNVHLNVSFLSENRKFSATISSMFNSQQYNLPAYDFASIAWHLPPSYPTYNADGTLYWFNRGDVIKNPLAQLRQSYSSKTLGLNNSIAFKYALARGLDVAVTLGYNRLQMDQQQFNPLSATAPGSGAQATSVFSQSYTRNSLVEFQVNYSRAISRGLLTALVGATYQSNENEQPYNVSATGFPSDVYITNVSAAASTILFNGYNAYKYASVLSRVNYTWDKKYVINVNFRRDGSSKFASNSQFGNFGSLGAAWIFSDEKWLKSLPWLSFGKLRTSYGLVGSDNTIPYGFLSTYQTTGGPTYNGAIALNPVRLANSDYRWESTKKAEVGLELGFFDNRILLTTSYYRNRSDNQLISYPSPSQTGFTSFIANSPANVENRGLEITLNTTNIKSNRFQWQTYINISKAENKLLAFPNLEKTSLAGTLEVGKPLGSYFLFHYTGINSSTGLPDYEDVNKDGILSVADRLYAGTPAPKIYGGIGNNITYKNFTADFYFQFAGDATIKGLLSYVAAHPGSSQYYYNVPVSLRDEINALSPGLFNKMASTKIATSTYLRMVASDALLHKVSYGRFTNAAISYNFTSKVLNQVKMKGARIFIQAQNIFTFYLSKGGYQGIDPETGPLSTPPLRVFRGGINLTF